MTEAAYVRCEAHMTFHALVSIMHSSVAELEIELCAKRSYNVNCCAECHKQPGKLVRQLECSTEIACMQQGMPFLT